MYLSFPKVAQVLRLLVTKWICSVSGSIPGVLCWWNVTKFGVRYYTTKQGDTGSTRFLFVIMTQDNLKTKLSARKTQSRVLPRGRHTT